jgi:hypothetical protein
MTAQLPDTSILGPSPFDSALEGPDKVIAGFESAMGLAGEPKRFRSTSLQEAQSAADFSIAKDNLYERLLADSDHEKAPQVYRDESTRALQQAADKIVDPVKRQMFIERNSLGIELNANNLQTRAVKLTNDGKINELARQALEKPAEAPGKLRVITNIFKSELNDGVTTFEEYRDRFEAFRQRYGDTWLEAWRRRNPAEALEHLDKVIPMRQLPSISASDRDLMIRTVLGEAGNESDEGKAAVSHVILTRAKLGNYGGKTVEGVVFAPKQFEPWQTRRAELLKIDPKSPEYQRVASIVDGVLSGEWEDPTDGATHFYSPSVMATRGGPPKWALGKETQRIGDHLFLRPDDPAGRAQGRGTPTDFVPLERLIEHRNQAAIAVSAQAVDRDRAQRVAEREARRVSDEEAVKMIQAIHAEGSTIQAGEIAGNKQLSMDAQARMIEMVKRRDRPDPPADASERKALELSDRIWLRDGDPAKIGNADGIDDAYNKDQLSQADFARVRREFEESRSEDGKRLAAGKANFINRVRQQITASNPWVGRIDTDGELQLYRLGLDVQNKIDDYRKAGKNPHDLFDPSKPDYLGRPEIMESYKRALQDVLQASGGIRLPKARPAQ